jgi:glycerol-3-phosphate acyltransferase PlsY
LVHSVTFFIVIALAAYLVGAIPTGLVVGKVGYGVDIRELGSGNIGSTNAKRVLGSRAGNLVLVLDVFKGFIVTWMAAVFATGTFNWPPDPKGEAAATLIVIAAIAAIIGNVFPIYIGFKGGKGVGVGAGVVLALVPIICVVLLAIWLATRALTRYVSVASILIAVLFPFFMWWQHPDNIPYIVLAVFATAVVVFSHRANLKRLLAGKELRVGDE